MLRVIRLLNDTNNLTKASSLSCLHRQQQQLIPLDSLPSPHPSQRIPTRFLDIYQLGTKEAIEKERARLKDELNRGYFADMAELKKRGGKIAMANKIIIPAIAAVKFPDFEGNYSNGSILKLPLRDDGNAVGVDASIVPKVSLFCLSFRANFQQLYVVVVYKEMQNNNYFDNSGIAAHVEITRIKLVTDTASLLAEPVKMVSEGSVATGGGNSLNELNLTSFIASECCGVVATEVLKMLPENGNRAIT